MNESSLDKIVRLHAQGKHDQSEHGRSKGRTDGLTPGVPLVEGGKVTKAGEDYLKSKSGSPRVKGRYERPGDFMRSEPGALKYGKMTDKKLETEFRSAASTFNSELWSNAKPTRKQALAQLKMRRINDERRRRGQKPFTRDTNPPKGFQD